MYITPLEIPAFLCEWHLLVHPLHDKNKKKRLKRRVFLANHQVPSLGCLEMGVTQTRDKRIVLLSFQGSFLSVLQAESHQAQSVLYGTVKVKAALFSSRMAEI